MPSQELCAHPFWQVRLPTLDLPPEPALEAFIARYNLAPTVEEMRQSTRDGLKVRALGSNSCFGQGSAQQQQLSFASPLYAGKPPPLRPTLPGLHVAAADLATRPTAQLDKGRVMRQSVDITRLSRIAQHNLEREGEGADYSSAVGGAPAAEAQAGDIRIDSADAELDFEENREEGEPVRGVVVENGNA